MKAASRLAVGSILAGMLAAGCGGAHTGEAMPPMVTTAPDEFVLRDIRRDAGLRMGCQPLQVITAVGPWSGGEGTVTAYGCGYRLSYYLRCVTNHTCTHSVTD